MQTSGVTARSCIADLAASNASDAVKPRMTVAFRFNDFHRCMRAGVQVSDRAGVGRPEQLHLRVEGADVPSLQGVPDNDRGSRKPALSEVQVHGLHVGPVR